MPDDQINADAPGKATRRPLLEALDAGRALLIYVVLLVPMYYLWSVLTLLFYPAERVEAQPIEPGPRLVSEGVGFLLLALAAWVLAKVEGRPMAVYGLGSRRLRDFAAGLGWGAAFLALCVVLLRADGLLVFDGRLLRGASSVQYAALWGVDFLALAMYEEYLNRGFLQFTLARGFTGLYAAASRTRHAEALGFWTAAALLSFLFGYGHTLNAGESPLGEVAAGAIGLLFCLSLRRTGSLWWAIGFHAAWDWAQSFLFGVADSGVMVQGHLLASHPVGRPLLSGGRTGPEGSVFMLPVAVGIAGVIVLTLPPRRCATVDLP